MLRSYKVEINPTNEQIIKINKTLGTCRFVYNFYINHNKEIYEKDKKFVTAFEFSKWLNNEFIPNNKQFLWIKEVSSKAVKKSIMNGEKSFKNFFKNQSGFPKLKKKNKQNTGCYFPKNNKSDFTFNRHRIKVPTLGYIRLKEYGYIPKNSIIKSGTITKKCDRYYISVLVDESIRTCTKPYSEPIGIDLGIKDFAVLSNGKKYENINKTLRVKRLEKSLKRQQRKLSRKYKENKMKGKATKNIQKQVLRVQKLHSKLSNIRTDYINKVISEIVKTKPSYITIEDLNVTGLMKNRHLSKAIQEQKFYEFRTKLTNKSKNLNIELRVVDRYYPSSKKCSRCGNIKKELRLKDREYECERCGLEIDRDLNASINLREAKKYDIG